MCFLSEAVCSAIFLPTHLSVGASSCLFGLFGALFGDFAQVQLEAKVIRAVRVYCVHSPICSESSEHPGGQNEVSCRRHQILSSSQRTFVLVWSREGKIVIVDKFTSFPFLFFSGTSLSYRYRCRFMAVHVYVKTDSRLLFHSGHRDDSDRTSSVGMHVPPSVPSNLYIYKGPSPIPYRY